ncbi:tryptophan 2,3-dioxygenase [Yunchengibacter salinarum]|uniref:tryptophan 2,3-dioxygenase n=1 Tax=Yunchengibacter salinarum TaxID=3133399 RepID=UPI0035B5EC21
MSYGGYLKLDRLLACQHRVSDSHDEMLFIIIHQASELWLKACLFELTRAMDDVRADRLGPAMKALARIARIQNNLEQSWEILATMTPADYSAFRDSLGQSSGFQSFQYRELEFRLGNKNPAMVRAHKAAPAIHDALKAVLDNPSFYDLVLQLLARRGFDLPPSVLDRDWATPYEPDTKVEAAWAQVYGDPKTHWDLYELAEKLVDLEFHFQKWRFAHMKTVERIIGFKRGTGGTSGVSYLQKALDLRFFPELWTVRTAL